MSDNTEKAMTRSDFAVICGVPRNEVLDAVRLGALPVDSAGNVLINHPLAVKWRQVAMQTTLKVGISEQRAAIARSEKADLTRLKTEAEIRLKNEQADAATQRRLVALGELIDRDLVARRFSQLGATMQTQFVDLAARIAPRLEALARSGAGAGAVESALNEEIGRALTAVIRHCEDNYEQ